MVGGRRGHDLDCTDSIQTNKAPYFNRGQNTESGVVEKWQLVDLLREKSQRLWVQVPPTSFFWSFCQSPLEPSPAPALVGQSCISFDRYLQYFKAFQASLVYCFGLHKHSSCHWCCTYLPTMGRDMSLASLRTIQHAFR